MAATSRKTQRKGGSTVKVPANLGIGHAKADIRITEIDNPHYSQAHAGASGNPRKITAAINMRESPVALMWAKKAIDDTQLAAASQFRRIYEQMGGKGAGSFDYSREPVDGGGPREDITDIQLRAGRCMKEASAYLSKRHFDIVQKVAGEGQSLQELFPNSHRERTTWADYLKHGLDDLAELWGLKTKRRVG